MVYLNCDDKLYNKTKLYSPVGDSTLGSVHGVPLNYFDPPWGGPNENLLHTLHEQRENSEAPTTAERKSNADHDSHLNDKYFSQSKKGDYKHAKINITTDDHYTESDYTDGSEHTVPTLDKWKKPRKKFMGKYFFSEIANSFLHPWNGWCPSTAPQSGVVNPRLDCLHYRIAAKRKGSEGFIKPEIIVRF
ncbi:hypothetical protein AK88_00431 [Plasmodium fragile]|uniref:Uncharacterized protein n=1 Tax=Plasmodium fragile TaxID=5857 RepID=A0A0D9QS92_PLAFR|nr:uncharacterized protein AK88_00431 [Plasmodium fragile]KJP89975.1 hypothetical protein AK88_00431 [Plasmodium fragile]